MLNKLIAFSLKNRLFIVSISLIIAISGGYIVNEMNIDVLPDLNRPTVVIMTEAHAMVPKDVEQLVTLPLEQIFNGATGVERIRSSSGLGLSIIKIEFAWGSDIYKNRQIVSEKLMLAKARLPQGVDPIMAPISSIMGQIHFIGLSSKNDRLSLSAIRAFADYQLKYDLLAIPGVAKVLVAGGAAQQLQVVIDADKLQAFNVTVNEVAEAIRRSNKNHSGAFINVGTKAPVITVTGLLQDKSELENTVIQADSQRPVRIRDVASVQFGSSAIKVGDAGIDARPGVLVVITKQPGYNTIKLTQTIEETLALTKQSLENDPVMNDILINPHLFKQADFIHRAIENVTAAVRDGAIMVVIILFLFLMNWRITFITITAIPLSIAVTAIVFAACGISINTMTLGGLAVAIGTLVDDAIVNVENVYRRLRQNHQKDIHRRIHPLQIVYNASAEVRKPILIGTILVIIVYIPLFFLSGMEGRLFTPIGIAYIISVSASLFISLTLTPALCYFLLPNKLDKHLNKESWIVRKLKVITGKLIRFGIHHAVTVLLVFVIAVIISLYLLLTAGSQFLPSFNEGVAQINLILPPDTGIETSSTYGRQMERILKEIKGVKYVTRRTGRAEGDEHADGVNTSEVIVSFDPSFGRKREAIITEIREKLTDAFPGVAFGVDQPLAHLLSATLSGVQAQVAVKIYGPDLNILRSLAKEAERAIRPINGVTDLMVEPQVLVPNIAIIPDRERLARHGLSIQDIGDTVEHSLGGEAVSNFFKGRYVYPIILRLKEKNRQSLQDIENLTIRKHDSRLIKLRDIASVQQTLTPTNIKHENIGRRIAVQHNISGRSPTEVIADINKALDPIRKKIAKKGGYSLKISGQFEAQQRATKRILILSIFSLFCMFLILYMHFKSINLSLQVLASIPMAFIGAIAYCRLTNQILSVATLVGLISLGGIAVRNAILLLGHYIHLMKNEGRAFAEETGIDYQQVQVLIKNKDMAFSEELIIKAGQERMVPVMMTALTSGIALIPLALAPGQPGKEILYPIATVIIGGLISCTLLDFIVRPAMFSMFSKNIISKIADPETIEVADPETIGKPIRLTIQE